MQDERELYVLYVHVFTQYARHRAARVTADRRNKEYAAFPTNAIRAPAFSGIPVKRGT
jgi:hypothetical protein